MKRINYLFFLSLLLAGCNFNSPKESDSISDNTVESKHRVIIIGVDGAGHQFDATNAPLTTQIFSSNNSATTFDCLTSNPTISAQCWGSMLTGLIPGVHGFTNDSIASNRNTTHTSIFKQAYDKIDNPTLASFCNWDPINYGIIEENIGVYKDNYSNDAILTNRICNYLEDNDPDLLFVQFDSVDHEGHSSGYNSKKYYDQIKKVDGYIADIYETLYDNDLLENTTFIVTADHGGSGYSHGGLTKEEKFTYVGIRGNNINKTTIENMQVRDFPAIVAYALNIEANESWDSYIPQNLFIDNKNPKSREDNNPNNNYQSPSTPDVSSNKGLYSYVDSSSIDKALFFDGNLDELKGYSIKKDGKVYYVNNAKYGKALNLNGDGYITLDNYMLDNSKSYTFASWINIQQQIANSDDPVFIGNKNWASGKNSGIIVAFRSSDIKLTLGYNGSKRFDALYSYPVNIKNWFHFMLVIDNSKREVKCYINFTLISTNTINDKDITITGPTSLNIGQDSTGVYGCVVDFLLDDFIIFNKALTSSDISSFKSYYEQ